MSVVTVARKDLRDTMRARMVWGLTAVFSLFSVLGVALLALLDVENPTAIQAISMLTLPSVLLAAIIVGYMAIVGERRSGSLKLLLGFPVSRGAILSGKVVGRTGIVAASITVAFALSGTLAAGLYGDFPVLRFAGFVGATVGLGVAFVGLSVGISATVRSRGRALAAAVGSYVLLVVGWQPVVAGLYYAIAGSLPGARVPAWYLFVERLSPTGAYQVLVEAALDTPASVAVISVRPSGAEAAPVAEQIGGDPVPLLLSAGVAAVVLVLWVLVPTVVGYWRFRKADL